MRVIQLGLGPMGRRVVELLLARGIEIVGAIDLAGDLQGTRLDQLAPGAPALDIARSPAQVGAAADAVIVTTSSHLAACAEDFRALLRRGLAVVSSCEELVYPWYRNPALASELDELAREHGGRLLGTGVNPGFLMDSFAVAASAVCTNVRAARIERFQNASARRVPFQRKIGAGMDPAELERCVREGSMGHVGLLESLHFVAAALALPIDRWDERASAVLAEDGALARGIRQLACGYQGDRLVIELIFQAAIGEPADLDRVRLEADPPIDLTWQGGVHGDVATTAILVNALPSLLEAPPGLHTMLTIPAVRCR